MAAGAADFIIHHGERVLDVAGEQVQSVACLGKGGFLTHAQSLLVSGVFHRIQGYIIFVGKRLPH